MEFLIYTSLTISLIAFSVVFFLTKQVAFLTQYLGPLNAREEAAGPRIGENVSPYFQIPQSAAVLNVLIFVSDSCGICKELDEVSIGGIAKAWRKRANFYYLRDDKRDKNKSICNIPGNNIVSIFDATETRVRLNINFVPMCVIVNGEGRVILKGMPNHVAHVENLLIQSQSIKSNV